MSQPASFPESDAEIQKGIREVMEWIANLSQEQVQAVQRGDMAGLERVAEQMRKHLARHRELCQKLSKRAQRE